jgi:uncharacterized membrane protein YfcA
MKRKFAYLMIVGILFGATFGVFLGEAIENPGLGVAFGALGGVFAGWFMAIIAQEKIKQRED